MEIGKALKVVSVVMLIIFSGLGRILGAAGVGPFPVEKDFLIPTLLPDDKGIEPGSWAERGFPYYSGTGTYSRDFDLTKVDDYSLYFVSVERTRDIVAMRVNGTPVGVRLWAPYVIDITASVKQGRNRLELSFINCDSNLLEGRQVPSGLLGGVRILSAPKSFPSEDPAPSANWLSQDPQVLKDFKNPPVRWRPTPLWFWNSAVMTEEEIKRQIRDFKEAGLGGFMIHPRSGFDSQLYLTPTYFAWVKCAVEEAARLGLEAWLYDEINWPSGTAGGTVRNPRKTLHVQEQEISGSTRVEIKAPDETQCVLAGPFRDGKVVGKTLNITTSLDNGTLRWDAPEGPWRIMFFYARQLGGVDYMNRKGIDQFIEKVHERYAAAIRPHLGTISPGIFKDEPPLTGEIQDGLPWTPVLFETFIKKKGYDVRPFLEAMYRDIGPETYKVRCDYIDVARYLYIDSWITNTHDWCARYPGFGSTGHQLGEENIWTQFLFNGDYLDFLDGHQIPGVDFLKRGVYFYEINHIKIARSSFDFLDRKWLISESFGAAGWPVTLDDCKWMSDWQVVEGVNKIMPHAFLYTLDKYVKWDAPRDFYRSASFRQFRPFSDYVSRTCFLASQGRHACKLLVFYPIKTFWAETAWPMKGDGRIPKVCETLAYEFNTLLPRLDEMQVDCSIINERYLNDARVEDGRITVGQNTFEAMLIPPLTTIGREAADRIRQFASQGGRLILLGALPDKSPQAGLDSAVTESIRSALAQGSHAVHLPSFTLLQPRETVYATLRQAFTKVGLTPDVEVTNRSGAALPQIVYQHRMIGTEKQARHLFILLNTTVDSLTSRIRFFTTGVPEVWDAESGEVRRIPFLTTNGVTEVLLDFAARQSWYIVLEPMANPARYDTLPPEPAPVQTVTTLGGPWKFEAEDGNVLIFKEWKIRQDPTNVGETEHWFATDLADIEWPRVTQAFGASSSYLPEFLPEKILKFDTYPMKVWYRGSFFVPDPERLSLHTLDIPYMMGKSAKLWVNGLDLGPVVLPKSSLSIESHMLRQGRNTVTLCLELRSREDGLVDPLRLSGNFKVSLGTLENNGHIYELKYVISNEEWKFRISPEGEEWARPGFDDSAWRPVQAPGNWIPYERLHSQEVVRDMIASGADWITVPDVREGFPDNPSSVAYRKVIHLDHDVAFARVRVNYQYVEGTLYINGTKVKTSAFNEKEAIDVTRWLKKGDNVIAIRTGYPPAFLFEAKIAMTGPANNSGSEPGSNSGF